MPLATAVVIVVGVAQVLAWQFVARERLAYELPAMLRAGLLDYQDRMRPHSVWPRTVHLVLDRSVPPSAAGRIDSFRAAYAPAKISVSTESSARAAGDLAGWRCRECTVVSYTEERNNPLFARVTVALSGGDHAVGYDHLYLNVLGHWVRVRTRFLWIT